MKKYLLLLATLALVASCTPANSPTPPPATETGNASGSVILSIYADFQCPACQATHTTVVPIFEQYAHAGKLKIEYRQYPLTHIHKNAMDDALAALCAADQGKYDAYANELYTMESTKNGATVSNQERIALAANVALDTDAFSTCLNNKVFEDQVKADIALGDSLGVPGTPTFFLDGKRLDMTAFSDAEGLKKFLDQVLAQ